MTLCVFIMKTPNVIKMKTPCVFILMTLSIFILETACVTINSVEMKTKTRSQFFWENQDFSVKSTTKYCVNFTIFETPSGFIMKTTSVFIIRIPSVFIMKMPGILIMKTSSSSDK